MNVRSARKATLRIHRRLAEIGHDLPLRLWDGTEVGPADAGFRLVLNHPGALRSMLVPPSDLTAGRAFLADDFDVEGSMVAAIQTVADLRPAIDGWLAAKIGTDLLRIPGRRVGAVGRVARLAGGLHSKERDRQAIQHHYDVGHDFYELFLDRSLTYSCAYFLPDDDDLHRAQIRKVDVICRKLGLEPGMRMLDIGCGWGSLVLHAACTYDVEAVGVTLSEDQARVAKQRVHAAGLDGQVEIRVQDYRDVRGEFDAVASVGMFEHVGEDQLPTYFQAAWDRTSRGGRFLNHGITTGLRREVRDLAKVKSSFVADYVFPDGALVPADRAVSEMQDAGFEVLDLEQLRPHYARTLEHWVERLEANEGAAVDLAGMPTYRIWRAYMAGSAIGFRSGDLGVVQVLGGKDAGRPFGRDWMLPAFP